MNKHFTRLKDKLAIVGFANTTRDLAPYSDETYEIWTLNEGANFDFIKRFDRLFQLHPRWDFTRDNCANDFNHFLWLQAKSGTCIQCKGTGKLTVRTPEGKEEIITCPANGCKEGTYLPMLNRYTTKSIYMQKAHEDIPDSVQFPLDDAAKFLGNDKYFTSSFAYMITLAYMMGYKHVELYGFEMGASTEYHYQRPNAEYLIGFFRAKGVKVIVPEQSSLCKGLLYGYENMRTGYRQQLDMRTEFLDIQLEREEKEVLKLEGQLSILKSLSETIAVPDEIILQCNSTYQKKLGLLNVLKGALRETENLTSLYDTYFIVGADGEMNMSRKDTAQHVGTQYQAN